LIAGLAFRNVLRNKERSLLTLVGVILAIGSFVALVSVAAGFTQRVERELGSREVHIYVTVSRASTLPVSPLGSSGALGVSLPRELQEVLVVEGVRSVVPVIRSSLDGPRSVIPVLAIPLQEANIVFKGGRFSVPPRDLKPYPKEEPKPDVAESPSPVESPVATPSPSLDSSAAVDDEVVSQDPSSLNYPLFVGQGLHRDIDELLTDGTLVVEEIPFVKGGEMGSLGFLDYSVLAPIDAFFAQRPDRGVHEYWISLDDEKQVEQVQALLESKVSQFLAEKELRSDYAGARKIRLLTRRQYLRSAQEYLGYGWLLQVAVSMVGVLIAVTASMNTMLMSTYERLGEYATLRAMGASRRVISLTIIYEGIFLNVTGGLLGLLFGYLATGVLDKAVVLLLEIPYPMASVTPTLLLQALGLSFCVGITGSVIPCFVVSRIDLVSELRKGL
jgi:putative ABC transport system permease protein